MRIKKRQKTLEIGEVYCGRHPNLLGLGNPFSHKNNNNARFKVNTLEQSINNYQKWLKGIIKKTLFQEELELWEKEYISEVLKLAKQIYSEDVKILSCWCIDREYAPNNKKQCHTEILYEEILNIIEISRMLNNL